MSIINDHKKEIQEKGEHTFNEKMPKQLRTLKELKENPQFSWAKMEEVRTCAKLPEGSPTPTNSYLDECFLTLKPIIMDLLDDLMAIQLWVKSLIPKVEDGDTTGRMRKRLIGTCTILQ